MRAFKISEEKYIREHYGKTPIRLIAEHLGRRKSVVTSHIKLMGLQLTPEQRKARNPFKKNQPAHNKGKSGKPNKTSFKVGHKPANAMHDGAISIKHKQGDKSYKYLRISRKKWVLLHRHIWEQANGPIPPAHIVTFIDGDSMNCELSNLRLISRSQQVLENQNNAKKTESIKHRYRIKKAIAKHRAEFPALFE
jgi:hypothetical protein